MALETWEREERTAARLVMRCVVRGTAFLDTVLPGWWDVLDLGTFDLSQGEHCVIGQLARKDMETFYEGCKLLVGGRGYDWGIAALSQIDPYGYTDAKGRNAAQIRILAARQRTWAWRHGFELPPESTHVGNLLNGWGALQEAWALAIAERRQIAPEEIAVTDSMTVDEYDITFAEGRLRNLPGIRVTVAGQEYTGG